MDDAIFPAEVAKFVARGSANNLVLLVSARAQSLALDCAVIFGQTVNIVVPVVLVRT